MYQLRNLSNRQSVVKKVKSDVDACQYLRLLVHNLFQVTTIHTQQGHDGVHAYSCESLGLGLFFLKFKGGIIKGW